MAHPLSKQPLQPLGHGSSKTKVKLLNTKAKPEKIQPFHQLVPSVVMDALPVSLAIHCEIRLVKVKVVVVAQLVEGLLPTPQIRDSSPNIGKILSTNCTLN